MLHTCMRACVAEVISGVSGTRTLPQCFQFIAAASIDFCCRRRLSIRTGSEPSLEPSGTGLLLDGSSMQYDSYTSDIQPAAPAEGLVGDEDDEGGDEVAGLGQYHSTLRVGRSSSLAGGLSRDWGHITPSSECPACLPACLHGAYLACENWGHVGGLLWGASFGLAPTPSAMLCTCAADNQVAGTRRLAASQSKSQHGGQAGRTTSMTSATMQRRQEMLRGINTGDAVLLLGGDLSVTVVQAQVRW